MRYQIIHGEAFPVAKIDLHQGEYINAESDAMIAMSGTVDVNGTMNGGLLGGIARRLLTSESFFTQKLTASRGPGWVVIGHSLPGGITDVTLDGSYSLRVQKDGYLAGTANIQVDTAVQNLAQGLLSREGFFVLKVHGTGTVFISSYGAIHQIDIPAGEEVLVDNGHLVAWPDYMQYHMERASNGWISSITSGECLVCRFRGPGSILVQTRKQNIPTTRQ